MRPGSRTLEAPRGNRYAPARGMRLMMMMLALLFVAEYNRKSDRNWNCIFCLTPVKQQRLLTFKVSENSRFY